MKTLKEKHCTYHNGSEGHFHRKFPTSSGKGKSQEDHLWMYLHGGSFTGSKHRDLRKASAHAGSSKLSSRVVLGCRVSKNLVGLVVGFHRKICRRCLWWDTPTGSQKKSSYHVSRSTTFFEFLAWVVCLLIISSSHKVLTLPPSPLPLEELSVLNPFVSTSRRGYKSNIHLGSRDRHSYTVA